MFYPYFAFNEFPNEIISQFCYYSKYVRKKLFDEIINISNDLIDKIDKNWSNIEIKFKINNINVGDNMKGLKKAINKMIDKIDIDIEINDFLKSIWINCALLYQIEAFILPYPFFTLGFDNLCKKKFNKLKLSIANKTYLTKRMLECFLRDRKHIYLNNSVMPKWVGPDVQCECNLTKNIIDFISLETINEMISEVNFWLMCESTLSTDKIKLFNFEIKKWAQIDYFWIRIFFTRVQNKENENLYVKYKMKMNKFNFQ